MAKHDKRRLIASKDGKRLTFSSNVTLTAAQDEGKKPTFSILAYTGVPMMAGGFDQPIIVELSGVTTINDEIPIYRDHDSTKIVGQATPVISEDRITATGTVMGIGQDAREVVALSKDGFRWQASIGASVGRREFLREGETAVVNGLEVSGPLVIARESVLEEISFVPRGADHKTSAAVAAKHHGKVAAMSFDEWLSEKGFSDLSEEQKMLLQNVYEEEMGRSAEGSDDEEDDVEAEDTEEDKTAARAKSSARKSRLTANRSSSSLDLIVQKTRRKLARKQEITAIAARFLSEHPDACNSIEAAARLAIESEEDPSKFELSQLRFFRNATPMSARRGGGAAYADQSGLNDTVIEAAVCMATKLGDVEKRFNERTLEAAHKHFPRGVTLGQLMLHCARANGCHDLDATSRDVLKAAFEPRDNVRAAGFSTISLPSILSNVANKFITEAFMAVEDSWRKISAIRPVSDFKQITNHSLTGDLQYEKVGAGGEIKHGTLSEQVYTNKAETYGKMLAITRRDIINDDLGAFAQVARRLGRGGALKINDVFWTEFMDNANFFTSGRGNYDDGTDTALDHAGLTAAIALWDAMTDPDGKPLGSTPRFLLVPPGQWEPAEVLMTSTRNNTGGSATTAKVPDSNVWSGMFEVVKSKYLSNASYTGYSAKAWYLLADPNDIPVIETCFLGGKEMPTVESADADFHTLGVQFRAYHDFGVTKQEYRGGAKFKGEN